MYIKDITQNYCNTIELLYLFGMYKVLLIQK